MLKYIIAILLSVTFIANAKAEMKLVILGTGTPNPDPDRSGPALAIISGGKSYIIDSGAGIVRRAAAAAKKDMPELKAKNLEIAFLTHLHSDHTLGLADLIFTPWVLTRKVPLQLFGPPGSQKMADNIIEAYAQDIDMRLHGSQPANADGYKVKVTEITKSGKIFEDENVIVEAILVNHGTWKYAYGYKFIEKVENGKFKTIVISGDTTLSPALIEAAKGADILVHEVFSTVGLLTRPLDWQKYHRRFHTSTKQVAEIANIAKPKQLILYHQLYWGVSDNDMVNEVIAAGYEGNVVSARDLDVFE